MSDRTPRDLLAGDARTAAGSDQDLIAIIQTVMEPPCLTSAEVSAFEAALIARLARAPVLRPPWLALAGGVVGALCLGLLLALAIPGGQNMPDTQDAGLALAPNQLGAPGDDRDIMVRWMDSLTEPAGHEAFVSELAPEYRAIADLLIRGRPDSN